MNRTLVSFGHGWWEKLPAKLTPHERETLQREDSPEERSKALRDFEGRSRRPATPEDSQAAEIALRKHLQGEYTSATVILPTGHGQANAKDHRQVRF